MTISPRLTLALDNCFASKRWTAPEEWMQIACDIGIFAIEASADNECDPLYTPPDALESWIESVRAASQKTGVRIINLYSGHGTYTTLGLAHPDKRVRDHIHHQWLKPMIRSAAALGAGLGFFCHAIPQSLLYDPACYAEAEADLLARLADLAAYAAEVGLPSLSVEQMYSPHQPPWRIIQAQQWIKAVFQRAGVPLYITLDTAHHVGQRHFQQPDRAAIERALAGDPDVWTGSADGETVEAVTTYINERPYLFAAPEDGDLYAWVRALGRYAPIIHLQQTDGTESKHRPFTARNNATGQVTPDKLLAALREAQEHPNFPPPCTDIALTLEIFSGTADKPRQILANLRESAAYWRQAIPEDGIALTPTP